VEDRNQIFKLELIVKKHDLRIEDFTEYDKRVQQAMLQLQELQNEMQKKLDLLESK